MDLHPVGLQPTILPKGIVHNTTAIYEEVASFDTVPVEAIRKYWHTFHTTKRSLLDPTARRLENFWWLIWGSDRRHLSGPVLSLLFKQISEGPTFVPLRSAFPRWEGCEVGRTPAKPPAVMPSSSSSVSSDHSTVATDGSSLVPSSDQAPEPEARSAIGTATPFAHPRTSSAASQKQKPHPILKKTRGPSNSGPRPTARFASPHNEPPEGAAVDVDTTSDSSVAAFVPEESPPSLLGTIVTSKLDTRSGAKQDAKINAKTDAQTGAKTSAKMNAKAIPKPDANADRQKPPSHKRFVAASSAAKRRPFLSRRQSSLMSTSGGDGWDGAPTLGNSVRSVRQAGVRRDPQVMVAKQGFHLRKSSKQGTKDMPRQTLKELPKPASHAISDALEDMGPAHDEKLPTFSEDDGELPERYFLPESRKASATLLPRGVDPVYSRSARKAAAKTSSKPTAPIGTQAQSLPLSQFQAVTNAAPCRPLIAAPGAFDCDELRPRMPSAPTSPLEPPINRPGPPRTFARSYSHQGGTALGRHGSFDRSDARVLGAPTPQSPCGRHPPRGLTASATASMTMVAAQGTIVDLDGATISGPPAAMAATPLGSLRENELDHGRGAFSDVTADALFAGLPTTTTTIMVGIGTDARQPGQYQHHRYGSGLSVSSILSSSSGSILDAQRFVPTRPTSWTAVPLGRTKSQLTLLLDREMSRRASGGGLGGR